MKKKGRKKETDDFWCCQPLLEIWVGYFSALWAILLLPSVSRKWAVLLHQDSDHPRAERIFQIIFKATVNYPVYTPECVRRTEYRFGYRLISVMKSWATLLLVEKEFRNESKRYQFLSAFISCDVLDREEKKVLPSISGFTNKEIQNQRIVF